jgi:hypothetical protein
MVGEAFLEWVIGDPKVQAAGKWLGLERRKLSPLFEEGKFPIVVGDNRRRKNSIRTNDRPQFANVGHPELKENLRGLPRGTLSNPGRQSATFRPPRQPTIEWVTKWPLVLDANELSRIFSSQYDANASYEDDPNEGPIYHTANALADRQRTFFDLLRTRLLVAEGTLRDKGQQLSVPDTQWGRKDRCLDVETSDLFDKEGRATTATWESTILRIPNRITKPRRPRPAEKALEAELKKRGFADGSHGRTDTQIAHDLVDRRLTGEDLDRAVDRIRQQLKRYYRRRDRS